ncbi:MAG: adenosylcobalamin-dependent ribonucleoside-diphosphate reductase [Methanobacterium sp.]|nr:adenosylcobalamin-dependent ribonucleoside-diphosphate reductase [Methanobacterium sp.]
MFKPDSNSFDIELSINARKVLERRYLLKDEKGNLKESPEEMFNRVANWVARVDLLYNDNVDVEGLAREFYNLMASLDFLPNSPTLMNAGTSMSQLSACFVLPVEDSMEDIFNSLKYMALIHKSGGGVGFSFSKLRPNGDTVKTTTGIASGPLSFMRIYDVATDVIKQGGRRRGANMGILKVNHPDIIEFISAKGKCKTDEDLSGNKFLTNFNLSVALDDIFIEKVYEDAEIELINPRNNDVVRYISATEIFDLIVEMAWKTGDPGILFMDEINRANPTPHLGLIDATNPCGEQPLLNYESCNLGSINLARMVEHREILWDKLEYTIKIAVHFLDNVIDANQYPFKDIEVQTLKTRKIGLGVMGFADMLIKLKIPYNSPEALDVADEIMSFISKKAREVSEELGKIRGSFPAFKGSKWDKEGYNYMRNATTTTIAPTGSISIIAGVSSGIEPLFAVSFQREVMEGIKMLEVNAQFADMARKSGFYSEELMVEIARKGSLQGFKEIPEDIKKLFITNYQLSPACHVEIQSVFQRHVDNGVSKTVNLPVDATPKDVREVFLLAYQLRCKGITVYRYESKNKQVLYLGKFDHEYLSAKSEYSGGCPSVVCMH